jgi:hypothetical protein
MSPSIRFSAPRPNKTPVPVVVVELSDGRIVARTLDELDTLPLEEQAAVAAALELELPPPGSV